MREWREGEERVGEGRGGERRGGGGNGMGEERGIEGTGGGRGEAWRGELYEGCFLRIFIDLTILIRSKEGLTIVTYEFELLNAILNR